MARPFTLSLLSLCVLLSATACFASSATNRFNQCQLNSLNALKPDHRVETEGGSIETWSSKHHELQCAGVTVTRRTIHRNGLQMPSYSPYSQMIIAIQGKGALGLALSGCAETYEEPAKESSSSSKPTDSHQKILQFSQGHVLLIPRGVPYWIFNTGDESLVTVTLLDISSEENQLDQSPREFYLAGNPDVEHPEAMKEQQQQKMEEEGGNVLSGFGKRFLARALNIDEDIANKLISPDDEMKQIVKLKEGLSVISPKWQGQDEDEDDDDEDDDEDESERPSHGKRVHKDEEKEVEPYPGGKRVHKREEKEVEPLPPRRHVRKEVEKEVEPLPPRRSSHEKHHYEEEEEDEEEKPRARRTRGPTPSRREGHRAVEDEDEYDETVRHKTRHEKSRKEHKPAREEVERGEAHAEWETKSKEKSDESNGLEETICSSKLQHNIARATSADFYNPNAGRIKNLNSQSFPALKQFGLSAQYVVLYKNGIYSPHWNMNANSVIYVIRGQGEVRVVNNEGIVVFDDELRKGQLLVVPQNFMVTEEAGEQGFEYVVFKTNDNAVTSYLKETFRAFPAEVLENIYKLKQSEVHDLKYNGNWGPLVNPDQSQLQSS